MEVSEVLKIIAVKLAAKETKGELVRPPKAASLFFKVWLLNMASAMFSYRDFREKGPWFESYLLGIEKHSFDNLRLLLEKGHKLYLKIWFYGLHRQPSTRMICPTSLRMALLPCLLMIQPYTVLQLLDGTLCYLKTKSDYHSGCMSKNIHWMFQNPNVGGQTITLTH